MRNHLVNEVGLDLEGLNPFPEHLHLDIDFHLTFPFACTYIIADYMEKSNEDFDENSEGKSWTAEDLSAVAFS